MKAPRIGYTTGVYDMFHVGHLNLLKRARENCDFLIVGVTTDNEVLRVKGQKPIISQEDRKKILEAIRYVDYVVYEDDTDKILAWENLKFDVIFKGSDWQGTELWLNYEKFFKTKGVDVVYFPYTKGISSTKIRTEIKK